MSEVKRIPKPVKYAGGQHYTAPEIVATFPPHTTYLEVFAGGLSVLFAKDPTGTSEVVNDLNGQVSTFWRVMQDAHLFEHFRRRVEGTPFSEVEYRRAEAVLAEDRMIAVEPTELAHAFFVVCRQSMAGRMQQFTPISTSRLRRGQNEQASAWWSAVDGLTAVYERMRRVVVLNRDGGEVLCQFDKPAVLAYCDPPFVPETRTSPKVYDCEMTFDQHVELLETLNGLTHANVALSGYRCPLYDDRLSDWNRKDFDLPNNAAGGATKRRMIASLWMNY